MIKWTGCSCLKISTKLSSTDWHLVLQGSLGTPLLLCQPRGQVPAPQTPQPFALLLWKFTALHRSAGTKMICWLGNACTDVCTLLQSHSTQPKWVQTWWLEQKASKQRNIKRRQFTQSYSASLRTGSNARKQWLFVEPAKLPQPAASPTPAPLGTSHFTTTSASLFYSPFKTAALLWLLLAGIPHPVFTLPSSEISCLSLNKPGPPLLGAMPHLHGVSGSSGAGGMPGAEAAGAWQQACCRAGSGWKQTGSSLGDTWHPTSCPAATWCSTEQEGREMFLACKLWGPVPVSCHADGTWHCNEGSKEKEWSNGAEVKAVCCFVWCIFLLSACVTCMFQGVLWQWLANWRVWWSVSTKMRIERQRYKVSPEMLLL